MPRPLQQFTSGRSSESFHFGDSRCLRQAAGGPQPESLQIELDYAHLESILTEIKSPCDTFMEGIQTNGLADRFTAEPADVIAGPYPDGADAILLSDWLLDRDEDTRLRKRRNGAAAVPPKRRLFTSESFVVPDPLLLSSEGFRIEARLKAHPPHVLLVAIQRKDKHQRRQS
jgi:hypothetical protein